MTITRASIPLLAAALMAIGPRAAAQETALAVKVTAAETRAPLQGARVKIDGRNAAVTDAQGAARIAVRAGTHRVEVTAIGRRGFSDRVEVAAGETRAVDVALAPEAVRLDPVTATAEATPARSPMLQAFYDRVRSHSSGKFFTREYIARRNPQQFSDLLLDRTGMRWQYTRGGHRRLRFRTAVSGGGTRDCPPRYYINGVPFEVETVSPGDPSPDLWVHVDEIEGVEVYPQLPPIQYAGLGAGCGVILIWLREDARGTVPAAPNPPPPPPSPNP
ncbi:MAG TPA: carboxypeptidase-like regulatory domain-containing protein [Longimicrobium sp.]